MGTILLGLIFLAVVSMLPVAIPLAIAITITLVVLVLVSEKQNRQKADQVIKAILIDEIAIYKEKVQNTGFSIGWRGSGRSYYRYKNVLDHYECVFSVVYKDGTTGTIKCIKGSDVYNTLIWKMHN